MIWPYVWHSAGCGRLNGCPQASQLVLRSDVDESAAYAALEH
jgi:hypothetical protein